jgi:hypothetical protein
VCRIPEQLNILVQHPGRQFKAIEGRRTPFTTVDVKMRALYRTNGMRVVAADVYVVEMVVLREVVHRFEESWTIVSNNLMERSPPAKDILIDPVS